MKVLALVLLAVVLADGKGSGPYIYERPDGRAFYLPSEIVNSLKPVVDVNLQGSESSGSDSLREYGPPIPLETSQNLLNQGLPDVTIENTFELSTGNALSQDFGQKIVSEAKPVSLDDSPISAELPILDFEVKETTSIPNVEQATEVIYQSNQLSNTITAQTEQNVESQTTELANVDTNQAQSQETLSGRSIQQDSIQSLDYQQETSTASNLEKVTAGGDSFATTEVLVNVPESPSEKVAEVQNIPDIIANFEKEILAQQTEGVSDIGAVQPLGQFPEGFLEYGPPGFIEYGPPKGDEDKPVSIQAIITNETRRRRFSPRLRFVKN
ncbi:uncharacterized protein LOC112051632 [Bicyclus anynana]|uniref:Uncharacterized protein LOC112051632 n=1 Tax=Bicyclus anynana TaxID=110368 RepID=A0A6J1NGQ3_BICAN|nr:uncharacterized protein LOC112051632 [Bicyclus anynana]